jgi:Flp pilus assembly protein CpaB
MRGLLRDRGLALVALVLAVVGLAAGGGSTPERIRVVVAARAIPADSVVTAGSLRVLTIAAADRTPGMATRRDELVGRLAQVRLAAGDYVLRAAVTDRRAAIGLRPGERAVPISIETSAAPPLALLRAGARVDVVAERDADGDGPARSQLIARDLSLLVAARVSDDGIAVTLRAPLGVALALATAQAQAHRLRLFALPAAGADGG